MRVGDVSLPSARGSSGRAARVRTAGRRPVPARRASLLCSLGLAFGMVAWTWVPAGLSTAAAAIGRRAERTPTMPVRYLQPVFSNISITRNLAYGKAGALNGTLETLRLDLYQPAGDTARKRPVIVFVHGGGFAAGDKQIGPAPVLAAAFAHLGYVTVSIDYRLLSPTICDVKHGFTPVCLNAAIGVIHDAQAAVRWLRAKASPYRIDTSRIGIEGESAGGIAATGVAMLSDQPGSSGTPNESSRVGWFGSISGGMPGGRFVQRAGSPGILFSGTADPVVPYAWSASTAAAMRQDGVPVQLVTLVGAGHVPWQQDHIVITRDSILSAYRSLYLAHADT
jgi:acetyl esterase/lipase